MGTVELIVDAARFGTLLGEAATWCERITLGLSAPRSEHATVDAWARLLAAHAKYDRVIVNDAAGSEGWLLHRLHETSTLRLIRSPHRRFEEQLLRFERGGDVRLFLARAPLTRASFVGECGAVVHFRGATTDEFALSFQVLMDQWRALSRVPSGSELDALTTSAQPKAAGQVPPTGTPLEAATDERALFGAIARLFATGIDGKIGAPSAEASSDGEVLWAAEAGEWRLRLVRLPDGVRLELSDGGPHPPVELVLRTADSSSASSGLVLTDPDGSLCLAWRGGLLGSSEKQNQTLWSQCRLPTLEVSDSEFGEVDEGVQRVALVARAGEPLAAQLVAFAEEVRRLQLLLAPRERRAAGVGYSDFSNLEAAEQAELVWRYLIGLGAVPVDEAVRVCAQGLREDGYVQYQRLRRDGALYELLSRLLRGEASAGVRVDRPERGRVRAIQPELDDYERDDWLDCLVNALPEGEVLDRASAMRLIFNYAREIWGLAARRLRSGGKSEKAIKSALNSAIRRGLLRRIGAAYVEKVTATTQGRAESAVSPSAPCAEPAAPGAAAASPPMAAEPPRDELGRASNIPRGELLAQPNLGRGSLLQTLEALDEARHELEQPHQDEHLLAGWRRLLQRLPPLDRMILARRSGSHGRRETLESLGETLGLTRERVRQIETRCLESIRQRSSLGDELAQRLTLAFAGGRSVPVHLLLQDDPWWQGMDRHPDCADYLFERLLGNTVHRLVVEQGGQATTFYARFTSRALQEAQRDLLAQAAKIVTPAPLADYERLLDSVVQRLDPTLREALQGVLEEQLNVDDADPERVLSFGNTKPDRVLALLASQPQPMPVSAVFEALGRCRFPDEVLYFRRGVVGLEQHFPDFATWLERLVPACIELMGELPAGRQWLVTELHDGLREAGKLPEWLGHWHLASLLRRSGRVEYLGRLRVAIPVEGHRQERIHLSDAMLSVLQAEGTPLAAQAIADRVRQQTDIRDLTLRQLLLSSPFVKLEGDLYGLIERDVPGGSEAIARAIEAVVDALAQRQRGLTMHQAHQLAQAESGHAWSLELITSLLRSEPQLRLSRSGHVGLSSWDDVRAPTRGELIRQQVEKAGGRLSLDALQRALLERYGRELERPELLGECHRNQLQLDGDTLVAQGAAVTEEPAPLPPAANTAAIPTDGEAPSQAASPEPPGASAPAAAPATALDLTGRVQGLPAAARQHFEELLQQPLRPTAELLERARAHLAEIEAASRHNEFIDTSLAKALVERMERLIERVEGLSPITRRIAQAAVLYFISTEDAEDDFNLGGLEDDDAVLSAVNAHLELS